MDWGLHAVIYPKNKFSLEEAKTDFAIHHKPKFMRETKSSYRYRVIPKTRFKQYRSKKLPNGSTLIYGELLPKWAHLSGSGFFDKIKSVAKNVASKIASVPGKIVEQFSRRHNYNNTSRLTLDKHKDEVITKMIIVRTPILAVLDKIFNVLSFGSWAKAKAESNYDQMFHLQLRINNILVEKNEVINITENLSSITDKSEQLIVSSFPNITIGEFMQKAEDSMGTGFWLYDAFKNNCQNFIMGLLSANNCLTEEAKAFIYQPVEELVKRIPKYMGVIAKGATNLGAVANRLMGKGEMEDKKAAAKAQYLKEVEIGEKQNMKGIAWRKRLREDPALKAKMYEDAKTMPIDDAYRDRVMSGSGFNPEDLGGAPFSGYANFHDKQITQKKLAELHAKKPGKFFINYYIKDKDDGNGNMVYIGEPFRAAAERFNRENPNDIKQGFKDAFNIVKMPLSFIPGVGQILNVADNVINGGSRNSGYISALVKGKFKNKKFDLSKMKDPSKWLQKKYEKQDERIITITELIKELNEVHVPRLEEFDKNIDTEIDAKKKEIMSIIKSKREAKKLLDKWMHSMREKKRTLRDEYNDLVDRIEFLRKKIMMRKRMSPYIDYTKEEIKEFDQRQVDRLAKISIPKMRYYRDESEALDAHAAVKRTIGMGKKSLTEEEEKLKNEAKEISKAKSEARKKSIAALIDEIMADYPNVPQYNFPFKNKVIENRYKKDVEKGKQEVESADPSDRDEIEALNKENEYIYTLENATKTKLLEYYFTFPKFNMKAHNYVLPERNEEGRTEAQQIEYNIRKAIKADLVNFILSMPELAKLYQSKEPKIKSSTRLLNALGISPETWKGWTDDRRSERIAQVDPLMYKSKTEIVKALQKNYTSDDLRRLKIRISKPIDDLIFAIKASKIKLF